MCPENVLNFLILLVQKKMVAPRPDVVQRIYI